MPQQTHTYDNNLLLKDAGLVAASAAAQVGGSAKVIDLGAGRVNCHARVDVDAIEVATGDEVYGIELQFSSSPTFASDIVVGAILRLGDSSVAFGSADNVVGQYEFGCPNEFAGVVRQYCRLFTRVAGTIATGINYNAYLTIAPGA